MRASLRLAPSHRVSRWTSARTASSASALPRSASQRMTRASVVGPERLWKPEPPNAPEKPSSYQACIVATRRTSCGRVGSCSTCTLSAAIDFEVQQRAEPTNGYSLLSGLARWNRSGKDCGRFFEDSSQVVGVGPMRLVPARLVLGVRLPNVRGGAEQRLDISGQPRKVRFSPRRFVRGLEPYTGTKWPCARRRRVVEHRGRARGLVKARGNSPPTRN